MVRCSSCNGTKIRQGAITTYKCFTCHGTGLVGSP